MAQTSASDAVRESVTLRRNSILVTHTSKNKARVGDSPRPSLPSAFDKFYGTKVSVGYPDIDGSSIIKPRRGSLPGPLGSRKAKGILGSPAPTIPSAFDKFYGVTVSVGYPEAEAACVDPCAAKALSPIPSHHTANGIASASLASSQSVVPSLHIDTQFLFDSLCTEDVQGDVAHELSPLSTALFSRFWSTGSVPVRMGTAPALL
eukprot:3387233-Rhodomonas_salina.1